MAEIREEGYQDIRDYIQSTWKYIELRNQSTPIIRLSVEDDRASWTHVPDSQVLELSITISGDDIPLPSIITTSALYKFLDGGSAFSVEDLTPFTMIHFADELTVKHYIQIPKTE